MNLFHFENKKDMSNFPKNGPTQVQSRTLYIIVYVYVYVIYSDL